jgi:uncharacterized membrane protein YoaK (UPF0700 family)
MALIIMVGGNTMAKDYYFDNKNWEVNQNGVGRKVHPLVALMIAPLIGGLFVVFMPFIGLYLFTKFMLGKVIDVFKPALIPTGMAVGASYMTGAPTKEGSRASEEILKDLLKEVEDKREQK